MTLCETVSPWAPCCALTGIIKFLCLAVPLRPRGEPGGAVVWLMNAASHKKDEAPTSKAHVTFYTLCIYSNCSLLSGNNSVLA